MRQRLRYLCLSALFFGAGAGIYLLFQPKIQFLHWAAPALASRRACRGLLTSYGADLCWAAAFTLTVQAILMLEGRKHRLLLLCAGLGFFFELGQGLGWIAGTFDPIDLLVYVLGTCIAMILTKQREESK